MGYLRHFSEYILFIVYLFVYYCCLLLIIVYLMSLFQCTKF